MQKDLVALFVLLYLFSGLVPTANDHHLLEAVVIQDLSGLQLPEEPLDLVVVVVIVEADEGSVNVLHPLLSRVLLEYDMELVVVLL